MTRTDDAESGTQRRDSAIVVQVVTGDGSVQTVAMTSAWPEPLATPAEPPSVEQLREIIERGPSLREIQERAGSKSSRSAPSPTVRFTD